MRNSLKIWQDREIFASPIFYCLCTTRKMLEVEAKKLKIESFNFNTKSDASTQILCTEKGKTVAIVCLFNHNFDIEQIHSMLCHEAVHIFQYICRDIGEQNPSEEFQAYSIQRISQNLFYEYKRQLKKPKRKVVSKNKK